jgi:hypothetical protein
MIALVASLFAPAFALSAQDSVAVIYRPGTVLVQVNEKDSRRLQELFDWAGAGRTLERIAADGSFRLRCARNEEAATCTIRFYPSAHVQLFPRGARTTLPAFGAKDVSFASSFASSNGDTLAFSGEGGALSIQAQKK